MYPTVPSIPYKSPLTIPRPSHQKTYNNAHVAT